VAQVRTPVLGGSADVCEVWRCGESLESGQHGRVRFRRSDQLLFGSIAVAEKDLPGPPHATLHAATTLAYDQICAVLEAQPFPHLLRVWNYLPDINRETDGTERYLQFNTARQRALRSRGRALTGNVPAASALGAASGSPLVVYFLAGRTAPAFVENPRQVSAYHYPRQYGAHSPVFSRAALVPHRGRLALFISGTASIVGHRSPGKRRGGRRAFRARRARRQGVCALAGGSAHHPGRARPRARRRRALYLSAGGHLPPGPGG
jgi:hypothetical protein